MGDDDWVDTIEEEATVLAAPPDTSVTAYVLTLKEKLELEAETRRRDADLAQERLGSIKDRLFEKSMMIVDGVLSATDLDLTNPMEIPEEWVQEVGEAGAKRRHFAALEGLKNSREAPVMVKVAETMATAIIRANATEKAAPRSLAIDKVTLVVKEQEKYPELIIEDEEQGGDDDDY
jgi:hypothetical protein